ncbi:tRNA (adenosine(37)-N6)-threonylcarbamoyltransferase complex ATPase subunit type 1 TsaE [Taibaiella chishuiensis]|uniref:tRNA threonylcarbamoyladenosine biosynthesis protein TsaE n=1 Tax=Taibaiella chishuiensis TaxID=1434707 RepID=A0A2P8D5T7_9BACT|nr:tRNA (adenosine(37)-N6)-threonylcarbamoyltransferase complex ATPase subunit type 1 TsaE [Taibaiella chishuiensis]PSK92577.1 tRNA threonylcarbamoyladenosine biosynthesis protein TsaE [Taibaiella chishuiensis]
MQITYTLNNIAEAVQQFWQYAQDYRIMAFSGTLGAGKTTFTSALCRYLGVQDAVSSPTFSLINEYTFVQEGQERTIYHSDWYRLHDADDAINAGIEDMLQGKGAYCIIEWPERAPELLPPGTLYASFSLLSPDERQISVSITG